MFRHAQGFRGIDPHGLEDLAALVDARGMTLEALTFEAIHHLGDRAPAAAGRARRRLLEVRVGCDRWHLDLVTRATMIRRGQAFVAISDERLLVVAPPIGGPSAADAVADIERWLSQSSTDWDVTRRDLDHVAATLRRLPPDTLTDVLLRIDDGLLRRWLAEMRSPINGFSEDERAALFADIASAAGPDALARLGEAANRLRNSATLRELGHAIGFHHPTASLPEVAAAYAARVDATWHSARLPAAALDVADPAAHSGLLQELLRAGDGWLPAVALLVSPQAANDEPTVTAKDRMATALAGIDDADLRAVAVIALLRREVALLGPSTERDRLDDLIEALLVSGPADVLAAMADEHDPDGELLGAWFGDLMVSNGRRLDHLEAVVGALLPDGGIDAAWLAETGAGPVPFPNATAAGYLAGTLEVGVEHLESLWHVNVSVPMLLLDRAPGPTGLVGDALHRRIDAASGRLDEQIDERFEVGGAHRYLAHAIDAFDEARDGVLRR